jgi:hypothetical protein
MRFDPSRPEVDPIALSTTACGDLRFAFDGRFASCRPRSDERSLEIVPLDGVLKARTVTLAIGEPDGITVASCQAASW